MNELDRVLMLYGFASVIKDDDGVWIMSLDGEIEQLKRYRDPKELEQAISSLEELKEYDNIIQYQKTINNK